MSNSLQDGGRVQVVGYSGQGGWRDEFPMSLGLGEMRRLIARTPRPHRAAVRSAFGASPEARRATHELVCGSLDALTVPEIVGSLRQFGKRWRDVYVPREHDP